MDIIQKIMEEALQNQLGFSKIGTILIKKRFNEKGIKLNRQQISSIEKALADDKLKSLTIDFTPNQEAKLLSTNQDKIINLDFSDSEKDIEKIWSNLEEKLAEDFPRIFDDISMRILKNLKRDSYSMLKYETIQRKDFEDRIYKRWKKPFRLLEMIHKISYEAGEEFNAEFRSQAAAENDYVFDVLSRMHARACQISSEIICLLKAGFADGANARWRTLHEIAVTCSFVEKYGNEIAEKYLLHDKIESYKAAIQYREYTTKLELDPILEDEFRKLEEEKNDLSARFGKSYKENYGWASETLGKIAPKFDDIEKDVGLDHLRPYYKLASHNVHAGPKGILFKLGLFQTQDILLAGSSNYGFADPAQLLASSLTHITSILLLHKSNIDRCITCNILNKLTDETANEFLKIQKRLEEEDVRNST